MANTNIFGRGASARRSVPETDAVNQAGGRAYKRTDRHALAQYACTGTFTSTYYTSAKDQLDTTIKLANKVDAEFVGKIAIYSRKHSFMKDMPAFLCASLASRKSVEANRVLERVFPVVIDNGKMVRNFVQIMRSGVTGRRGLGNLPKRLIKEWFEAKSPYNLFTNSIGTSPSLNDVMRMVHPRPGGAEKAALFAYLMGAEREGDKLVVRGTDHATGEKRKAFYEHDFDLLPRAVREFEDAKVNGYSGQPDIPFQFLENLNLDGKQWGQVAVGSMTLNQLRQHLNHLNRAGAFDDQKVVSYVAEKLANKEEIAKSNVFPYQLMMAYYATEGNIPFKIREALQDAMEIATSNVPEMGKVYVAIDVSGSMGMPATGYRGGNSSKVRCVDVAALFGASVLRTNREAELIPFAGNVVKATFNPRDTVATNSAKLASYYGGATNCSAPLHLLNSRGATGDAVIYVSDNQSWVDSRYGRGTAMMDEWNKFSARNPHAKLVNIDIVPYNTSQTSERKDILQVGGFSDRVFDVVGSFLQDGNDDNYWVSLIDKIEL
jgi:60 kDa SS-A/Ro ribonucleoprotein